MPQETPRSTDRNLIGPPEIATTAKTAKNGVATHGTGRPGWLIAGSILAIVAMSAVWLGPGLTRGWRVLLTGTVLAGWLIALLVWVRWLSGWPIPLRRRLVRVALATLGLLCLLFRVERVTGDLVPRLTWRFGARPHELLPKPPAELSAAPTQAAIDLTQTTPRDWPQFRGPRRDGIARNLRLARDWHARPPRLIWQRDIGAGWSSFAVVGNYALTQEQRGEEELVVCYQLLTGEPVWSHADRALMTSPIGGDGPRSTPTIDQGRVYTLGATGLLNCLDGATGRTVWPTRDVLADSSPENAKWGKSCSPLVVDDLVIVTGGAEGGPKLLAYDAHQGTLRWSSGQAPAEFNCYSSPLMCTLAEVRQIVLLADNRVAGFQPDDGRELWSFPWPGENPKVTQPIALPGDRIFVSSGYGVGCALLQLKPSSAVSAPWQVEVLWQNRNLRPKFSNVVEFDDYIYGLDEGILTCLDLADGRRCWKQGRYNHGQLLLVGDLLLIQAEFGEVVLVKAQPERHQELSRFTPLSDKTWNTPALAAPYLLVRNDRQAACYELPLEDVQTSGVATRPNADSSAVRNRLLRTPLP